MSGREQGAAKRPKLQHVAAARLDDVACAKVLESRPKAPALDDALEHGASGGAHGYGSDGGGGGGGVAAWAFANDPLPLGLASALLLLLLLFLPSCLLLPCMVFW